MSESVARRRELSKRVDSVYAEMIALVESGLAADDPEYAALERELGDLEKQEAAAFLQLAEAQLEMPLDAGRKILDDLRREETRLANLAAKKRAPSKAARSAL